MPAGQGKDAEQLATAIELGATPESVADGELARDLEIVAILRSRGAAYDPLPDARSAAKQRLMAALAQQHADDAAGWDAPASDRAAVPVEDPAEVTDPLGRLTPVGSDDDATAVTAVMAALASDATAVDATAVDDRSGNTVSESLDLGAPRPRRAARHHGRSSRPGARHAQRPGTGARGLWARAVLVGAAALLAVATIAGTGSFASRDALPGDALYTVKRISEDTGTALTFDGQALAQRYLELATTRIGEVESLAGRSSAPDAALVEDAMADFDATTGSGARELLGGDEPPTPAELGDLRAWAAEHAARLTVLRSSLPADAVPEVDGSVALLDRLVERTEAFSARAGCAEVVSSSVDDLGRIPAETACSPQVPSVGAQSPSPQDETGTGTDRPATTVPETDGVPPPGTTVPQDDPTTPEDESLLPELPPLPPLLPDGDEPSTNTTTAPGDADDNGDGGGDAGNGGGDGGQISVPLPLLPPIQLPPLLPGLPGVSLG